jgi:hypothetical protein
MLLAPQRGVNLATSWLDCLIGGHWALADGNDKQDSTTDLAGKIGYLDFLLGQLWGCLTQPNQEEHPTE